MGKLIELDAAYAVLTDYYHHSTDTQHAALREALGRVETVDAVPVRCKNCKYNPNPPECGNADCVLFYGMTDQMGFCHHGERREQDETD